jgi:hypothetical protein
MIQLTAPKHYQYRHIATNQIIGKTLYFCDWADYAKYELVYCNKYLKSGILKKAISLTNPQKYGIWNLRSKIMNIDLEKIKAEQQEEIVEIKE